LLERICSGLGVAPGRHEERGFEDGEHKIRPLESVRGRDVYLVESLHGTPTLSVNDKLTRALFFVGALRDAGAERVTVVAPYLCYMRKDRRTKTRDPVTTRYLATLFEAVGTSRLVTMDVHNPAAFENAFRIPTVHITGSSILVEACVGFLAGRPAAVVSPDSGGVKRAERFRAALEQRLERPVAFAFIEKTRSEGVVQSGAVGGDVRGRVALIVDDLISSGKTLALAAEACRERGATATYAAVTHGVFSVGASQVIEQSLLERIVLLDTIVPARLEPALLRQRVDLLDCAPLLGTAIARLHADDSLSPLTGL
jgi:ribose-phosphate pyrophosphokinase